MPSWNGALDEIRISPSFLSENRLLMQARNYLTPRDFYGVGQLNSATEINRSPVVPPTFGDATVNVSSELDPVARTFDPDTSDTKTLTRDSVTGSGTVTIVSNRARLLAPVAGLVRARAIVTDGGGKVSFAPLQWTVTGEVVEPPPPSGDAVIPYPVTPGGNDVTLSTNGTALQNGAALMNAYAALNPNSRLLIPARDYDTSDSAGFTFNKSGASAANPIVIEVMGQAYTQARFLKRIRITATDHCLIGLFVMNGAGSGTSGGGNACFGITGVRSRFSRCRADQLASVGRSCFIIAADDAIVDFFEATNPMGGSSANSDGRGICLEPTTLPRRWKIIRGHLHNFDQRPNTSFHEPVQCGRGGNTWNYNCAGLVLECRLIDATNDGEAFSIKSAGNTLRGNCLMNGGNSTRFTNRFGENNRWFANISNNADGFNDRGFSTLWHSNEIRGSGTLDLNAGNFTKAQWVANPGPGGFPASTDANCYYNDCTLQLGPDFGGPSVNVDPCANPTVRSHTGTVNNINSSSADIQVNAAPPSGTAPRITPVLLAVSNVGPLSNDGPT